VAPEGVLSEIVHSPYFGGGAQNVTPWRPLGFSVRESSVVRWGHDLCPHLLYSVSVRLTVGRLARSIGQNEFAAIQ
jgi:hypothetical protein